MNKDELIAKYKHSIKIKLCHSKAGIHFYLAKSAINLRLKTGASIRSHMLTGSAAGFIKEQVITRTVVELIERTASVESASHTQMVTESYSNLRKFGYAAIPLTHFIQHARGIAKQSLLNAKIEWCCGHNLNAESDSVLVPAQMIFNQFSTHHNLPLHTDSCGSAAHFDKDIAIKNAILEIIERDLLILSWRIPKFPVAQIPHDFIPKDVRKLCNSHRLQHAHYLISHRGLPNVVLSILYNSNDSVYTTGYGCAESLVDALSKSINEALMVFFDSQKDGYINPNNSYMWPRNSAEHIKRGFSKYGFEALTYYNQKATLKFDDKSRALNIDAIQEIYGSNICIVQLNSEYAQQAGIHVVKAVIVGACQKETDSVVTNLFSKRLRCFQIIYNSINYTPHIFG